MWNILMSIQWYENWNWLFTCKDFTQKISAHFAQPVFSLLGLKCLTERQCGFFSQLNLLQNLSSMSELIWPNATLNMTEWDARSKRLLYFMFDYMFEQQLLQIFRQLQKNRPFQKKMTSSFIAYLSLPT